MAKTLQSCCDSIVQTNDLVAQGGGAKHWCMMKHNAGRRGGGIKKKDNSNVAVVTFLNLEYCNLST